MMRGRVAISQNDAHVRACMHIRFDLCLSLSVVHAAHRLANARLPVSPHLASYACLLSGGEDVWHSTVFATRKRNGFLLLKLRTELCFCFLLPSVLHSQSFNLCILFVYVLRRNKYFLSAARECHTTASRVIRMSGIVATGRPTPLDNPNNYCYHNATLQCLASLLHRPEFARAVAVLALSRLPVARELARLLHQLAAPDNGSDVGSAGFVWRLLQDPTMNPRGSTHFEIGAPRSGYVVIHDASELLRRYIIRLFAGNPAGNPFELVLQRQTFRRDATGQFTIAKEDDWVQERYNALHIEPEPPQRRKTKRARSCDLPDVLRRQVFYQAPPNNALVVQAIWPHPKRGYAPCLAVTNGQHSQTCDAAEIDFALAAVNIDGSASYDCVAVCCFLPRQHHYIAYVRRWSAARIGTHSSGCLLYTSPSPRDRG